VQHNPVPVHSTQHAARPTLARLEFSWRNLGVAVLLVVALALAPVPAVAQKLPGAPQGPSVASTLPEFSAPAGDFVGVDRCQSCHKAETTEFHKTGHAKISFPGKDYIQGCETCHGPGKQHSDSIRAAHGDDEAIAEALKKYPYFAFRASAEENAARCLTCHISSKQQEFFAHSEHAGHGISCNQCHTTHLVDEVRDLSKSGLSYPQGYFFQVPQIAEEIRWTRNSLLKQSEPALCYGCHKTIEAQFALPEHHRVPEGLMKCSDCHNPHGSMNLASMSKPAWETCVKCHVEKRGPYVFEHPAAKIEGCVACHNPHGSTNNFLMVRREGRQLCLQCHTGFHDQAQVPHSRLGFQASGECTRCHVTIHGSNLDVNFLR